MEREDLFILEDDQKIRLVSDYGEGRSVYTGRRSENKTGE